MNRPSWDEYFIQIASDVAKRGTCLRRIYGAVITKDNKIISTGYNGAPIGEPNCTTLGVCERQRLNIPSGERYEKCRSVHAEANSIINGNLSDMIGSTIYIAGWDVEYSKGISECGNKVNEFLYEYADAKPCMMCARMIKNAKIERVVIRMKSGEIQSYSGVEFQWL